MDFFAILDFVAYALLLWWVWLLDKRVTNHTIIIAHWITEEQEAKEKVEPDA